MCQAPASRSISPSSDPAIVLSAHLSRREATTGQSSTSGPAPAKSSGRSSLSSSPRPGAASRARGSTAVCTNFDVVLCAFLACVPARPAQHSAFTVLHLVPKPVGCQRVLVIRCDQLGASGKNSHEAEIGPFRWTKNRGTLSVEVNLWGDEHRRKNPVGHGLDGKLVKAAERAKHVCREAGKHPGNLVDLTPHDWMLRALRAASFKLCPSWEEHWAAGRRPSQSVRPRPQAARTLERARPDARAPRRAGPPGRAARDVRPALPGSSALPSACRTPSCAAAAASSTRTTASATRSTTASTSGTPGTLRRPGCPRCRRLSSPRGSRHRRHLTRTLGSRSSSPS